MQPIALHITGTAAASTCRFDRKGKPVVELEIFDTGADQRVRVRHHYPDNTNASGFAARALAARLRGQVVELDAINPRFKAKRLECDAAFIRLQHEPTAGNYHEPQERTA